VAGDLATFGLSWQYGDLGSGNVPAMAEMSVVLGGTAHRVDGFELAYVTADGVETRRELAELWAAPLED
jgi:hypothetical protein